ncbi:hypothetical protein ElyMa_002453400 [Elysia marginata]|uniref:Uncharacterized protein n=1 Tax=Elysia marginata TaxID=1093978 RepID=A0AAV4GJM0_9GAST|nr:hypothetical protein ElyMa_002453400 [Elysia marginata]
MSDPDKYKLLLKKQLEAIGTKMDKHENQEMCSKCKIKMDVKTSLEDNCKETLDNRYSEYLQNTKDFFSRGTEGKDSSMNPAENEKDEINSRIKKSMERSIKCQENAKDNKQSDFLKNMGESHVYLTKDRQNIKVQELSLKNDINEKISKRLMIPVEEVNNDFPECEFCKSLIKLETYGIAVTKKSCKNSTYLKNPLKVSSGRDSTPVYRVVQGNFIKLDGTLMITKTQHAYDCLVEDNKDFEEKDSDETSIKEYFVNQTHEKENPKVTNKNCMDVETSALGGFSDDKNSGLHESKEIEPNRKPMVSSGYYNFLSVMDDRDNCTREEKVEKDITQTERSPEGKMFDYVNDQNNLDPAMSLSDLISQEVFLDRNFQFADCEESIKFKGKLDEKGNVALPEQTGLDKTDCLLTYFLSDSSGYDADDSFLGEKLKPLKDLSMCVGIPTNDFPYQFPNIECCFSEDCSCQENEVQQIFGQDLGELSSDMLPWNELSCYESHRGQLCYQNNIVWDSGLLNLDANFLRSLGSQKCKSKNVCPISKTSLVSFSKSCCSNSFNFSCFTSNSPHISDLDEAIKFEKSQGLSPSLQDLSIKKGDMFKNFCDTSNTDVVREEKQSNEKSQSEKKKVSRILGTRRHAREHADYQKTREPSMKQIKNGGHRNKRFLGDKKKKINGSVCEHRSHDYDADKRCKELKRTRKKSKSKIKRKGHRHKEKTDKAYEYTCSLPKMKDVLTSSSAPSHKLQSCKFRNHTGSKGSQSRGGGRSPPSSGAQGGGTGRYGGGSGFSGGFQGSGGGNQSSGSGGDHPDDHNSRKRNSPKSKALAENDDDDNDDTNNTKKKTDSTIDHHNENGNNRSKAHSTFSQTFKAGESSSQSGLLPNLPPPIWDDRTIKQRQAKEKKFHYNSPGITGTSLKLFLPPAPMAIGQEDTEDFQAHRRDSAPNLTSAAIAAATAADNNGDYQFEKLPVPFSAPVTGKGHSSADQCGRKHAVISANELCEVIGYAAINADVPPELFERFDICFTKVMHNLNFGVEEFNEASQGQSFAASSNAKTLTNNEPGSITKGSIKGNQKDNPMLPVFDVSAEGTDQNSQPPQTNKAHPDLYKEVSEDPFSSLGCIVCLAVSGLISHLSHDRQPVCIQCTEILNLMTQHARSCVAKGRRKQRITSSDLCYKICKKAGWCSENINCDSAAFKEKVSGSIIRHYKGIKTEGKCW